jgi:hypothetical protein
MARTAVSESASSTFGNPSWMSRPWRVLSVDADLGLALTETLLFTTPGTVKIVKDGQTRDWGKACKVTVEGLSGFTLDNRPFLIQYQPVKGKERLTCKVQPPPDPMIRADTGTWVAEDGSSGTEKPPHPREEGPHTD